MQANDDRVVELIDPADIQIAVHAARQLAERVGFPETDVLLIATAVSELATNVERYAVRGRVRLKSLCSSDRTGVEIVVEDDGPGMANVELALQENYSSRKDSLGLGLSSVRRIADEFQITSAPDSGTTVMIRKWRQHARF